LKAFKVFYGPQTVWTTAREAINRLLQTELRVRR